MRSLERNKQTIYYALYDAHIPVLDEFGNDTGQTVAGYHNPVKFKIRVSPNKGESENTGFGKSLDYDRVMNTADKNFPLDEYSICWIDTMPEIAEDGSTLTAHDYTVKKVAKDLNEWQYAIKKVPKNG
jgi:hypothetical protein